MITKILLGLTIVGLGLVAIRQAALRRIMRVEHSIA